MEIVDVGSIPAERAISDVLDGENLQKLAAGHGVACFALPGALHAHAFYNALIEQSASIDATTRRHVAFIVFHGNRSALLKRVEGYRPHLKRLRMDGLSTSTDAQIEVASFSADLGARMRFDPESIARHHFRHAMMDCSRALLDRFSITHDVEPCLLFVDPEAPSRHRVVSLDNDDPLRSLLSDVLSPLSDAFRELSNYWAQRDEARWRRQRLDDSREAIETIPQKMVQESTQLEHHDAELQRICATQEDNLALMRALLNAFDGEWRDADLRLPAITGAEAFQSELTRCAKSRQHCAAVAAELASLPDDDDHRTKDLCHKLEKSYRRSENKRLSRLGNMRKSLASKVQSLESRPKELEWRIARGKEELDRLQRRLDQATAVVAAHDPTAEEAETLNRQGQENALRSAGYTDEVISAAIPSAFSVVDALATRQRIGKVEGAAMASRQTIRVLFLASNPLTTSALDLEEELRAVELELRSVRHRDDISIATGHAVRPDDLVRLLRKEQPTIVHFSGHGSPDGVALRSESGHIIVPNESLARVFRERGVALIVLNTCYSEHQAQLLREVVPAVVGTTDAVGDEAARRFSTAFYRTLGDGHSIEDAFRDGGDAVAVHVMDDVFRAYGDLEMHLCGQQSNS